MESPVHEKYESDIDKIYVDLEQLKNRINRFICMVEGESAGDPRRKKIKTLTTKTKRLLSQHKQVKEELQYYENLYRTALSKNAKHLKRELKRDKRRLEDLKEQCRTQGVQVEIAMLQMNHEERPEKRTIAAERMNKRGSVFKGKYPSIKDKLKIQMRTNNKPAGRKSFKRKSARLSDTIKFQIQKNKETGMRELVFLNPKKAKGRYSSLAQKSEAKSGDFRECRIMLQKLTEEQAKKYTGEKKSVSSPENSNRKSAGDEPNWRIRIPREVLEESQNEEQITRSNASENATKPKRTRSTDKVH